MSTNKHSGQSKKQHPERPLKNSAFKQKAKESQESENNPPTQSQDDNKAHYHPSNVVINVPETKDKWTITNWVSLCTLIVTTGYFIATISILKASNKSVGIADSTLNEVKREFEIGNRPYVFFSSINLTELAPDSNVRGSITTRNYGKTPAFVLYEASRPIVSNAPILPIFAYEADDYKPLNLHIIDSLKIDIPFIIPISKKQYRDIIINKLFLFIHGKIIYRSVIDDRLYEYDYCYSLLGKKRFRPTPNHNLVKEIQSDTIPEAVKNSEYFGN